MGEISDALRRAGPGAPSLPGKRHQHREESEVGRGPLSRFPTREPRIDPQPPIKTEQRPVERSMHRLLQDGDDLGGPARICLTEPQSHSAQQYRRLAIRLRDMANARHARSIVITSAQAGDGKTTTACNLAIAMATTDHDSRVVLVDLDLHRAGIADALCIKVNTSIDAVLRGESTLEEAIMETDVDGLSIVAAGRPARQPEDLLAHSTLPALIAKLTSQFDWVIIDTPPVLATSDAQVILQHAAAALLVVRAGVSPVRALRKALDHLPQNKILASFLNLSRTRSQQHGYYADYSLDSPELESASSSDPDEKDELDVERS